MNKKSISKVTSAILLGTMLAYTSPVFAFTKEETVYSKLDNSGSNYKTIVSTHIQNTENSDLIEDMSDLLNIKNTNGEETFTQDGSKLTWNANKNDIYYEGKSEKELPVECKVKYELDGKEIEAKELAGKSGKVKIILQYTNKEERTVNVNGKSVKMYVPFVVVTGGIIKNDKAKNVTISSGKVADDGSKTIIAGIAMPGLQESLGVSKSDVDIPNDIEITMDATNFEMGNMITYVTPKILEENDLSIFNKIDGIYGKVQTLESSMNQIQEGATALADGTGELANGTNELKTGTSTAYNGANTISNEVNKSIKSLAADNSDALDEQTLAGIEAQAAAGATLTEEQKAGITAQAKASAVLTEQQKAGITAQAKANAVLTEEQKAGITAQAKASAVLTEEQKAGITAQAKANAVLTEEQKAGIIAQAKVSAVLTEQQKAGIIANASAAKGAELTETEKALVIATAQSTATTTAVNTALKTAQDTATTTAVATALKTAQDTATSAAKTTASKVASEVGNQVKKEATKKISSQMKTLNNGLNQLTNGLSALDNGAQALNDGANKLDEGAKTLSTGIKTFNEEGIKKICNLINGQLKDKVDRVKKLKELSEEYNNFTMLDKENDGNVKFIMIIDSIKKQEEAKQDVAIENKQEN